ncbi:MAG: 50S ribosomal protein L21e [Methanobacteriota archaeon]|nr:MAG: 50S ribosomal protein L21e [Euryarchaeota archaeon]
MVKRPRGFHSKGTRKLKQKRKITIADHVREFSIGQKVILKQQPYYESAMPHKRYRGRTGIIKAKRGSCYIVAVKDGNKDKELICHPVHLKASENSKSVEKAGNAKAGVDQ